MILAWDLGKVCVCCSALHQVHLVGADLRAPALSADLKLVMEAPGRLAKAQPCSGECTVFLKPLLFI